MINKKILIIGGTGALGQALTKKYLKYNEIIIFFFFLHKHVELSLKFRNFRFNIGVLIVKDTIISFLI
mgnify:CR=1 FL=1